MQEAYPLQFPEWNDSTHPSYYRSRPKEEKSQTLEEEATNSSNPQRRILNEQERDEQYRQIMEQLPLEATHQSQLIRDRGLGEFLNFIGFRSWQEVEVKNVSSDLPGVVEREGSFYLYGQPGLFLPICNELGQIIGFQLRPDDTSTGKYKWGSSAPASGNGPRLDNGEMPLAFCRPPSVELPSIGLAEGVLKAWSAACFLRQIVIGAPGATWDSTPKLLKRYLDKVAAERDVPVCSLVVDLYVDAGMLSNQQIIPLLSLWENSTHSPRYSLRKIKVSPRFDKRGLCAATTKPFNSCNNGGVRLGLAGGIKPLKKVAILTI